jgi:hypothetical protein
MFWPNHILISEHTYGTITSSMDIIKTGRKGEHLSILEKYYIYRISKDNMHMNDTHTTPYLRHCMNFTLDSSTHTPQLRYKSRRKHTKYPGDSFVKEIPMWRWHRIPPP